MASLLTVDASILIAIENPRDAHHDEAISLLDEASGSRWIMHPLTVTELLVGPARSGPSAISAYRAWLDRLGVEQSPSVTGIDLASPQVGDQLALLRASSGLKLPDCTVLQLALCARSALATADVALAAAARTSGIETFLVGETAA